MSCAVFALPWQKETTFLGFLPAKDVKNWHTCAIAQLDPLGWCLRQRKFGVYAPSVKVCSDYNAVRLHKAHTAKKQIENSITKRFLCAGVRSVALIGINLRRCPLCASSCPNCAHLGTASQRKASFVMSRGAADLPSLCTSRSPSISYRKLHLLHLTYRIALEVF